MQKKPNQETAGDRLLSQTALAKALKVCPVTVSRWTTARIIPCHRVGAKFVRYDLAAVLAAIAKAENKKGGQQVKRTLTQIHGAFCKPSMRVGAYKGAAVVVPAQIVAQHLEGLHTRDPF